MDYCDTEENIKNVMILRLKLQGLIYGSLFVTGIGGTDVLH